MIGLVLLLFPLRTTLFNLGLAITTINLFASHINPPPRRKVLKAALHSKDMRLLIGVLYGRIDL